MTDPITRTPMVIEFGVVVRANHHRSPPDRDTVMLVAGRDAPWADAISLDGIWISGVFYKPGSMLDYPFFAEEWTVLDDLTDER